MKLHLGCGKKHWPGFINVDLPGHWKPPDLACDIRQLPYPPESVEEIVAIHVLEHLVRADAEKAIAHWAGLLRQGGRLILEVPCLDKILDMMQRGIRTPQLTLWGLYGDQAAVAAEGEQQLHRWCYSTAELTAILRPHFKSVHAEPPLFHKPERDMRMVGIR